MTRISFAVRGTPVTQGSARAINHRSTGRAVLIQDKRGRLLDWRADIANAARAAAGDAYAPRGVPVVLSAIFKLQRPQSAPKRVTSPTVKPDADKLARALFDALSSVLYADDSQVVKHSIEKCYARADEAPGVTVWVEWE